MLKFAGRTGLGLPLLLLGLSGENVARLVAGEPIRISSEDLARMGLPQMVIAIHYGRTEQAILDEVKAHGVPVREGDADASL